MLNRFNPKLDTIVCQSLMGENVPTQSIHQTQVSFDCPYYYSMTAYTINTREVDIANILSD